jgi:AGZA family xanthine/uracil permease-like MFS transporter
MENRMSRYGWARWGDINAFFGLMLDNVAVMIVLVVLITSANPVQEARYGRDFVLTQMIPGTALGVVVGDLVFTWMAFRLARRSGRDDITAMPLGLDTPSTFAVGPLVLLPALQEGLKHFNHEQAMVFGWHVGVTVLVVVGIFKTLLAPVGGAIRRLVPRAGLLGSLAAIALALIAFVPLWQHVTMIPLAGMVPLIIILVTLIAHRALPGRLPGALAAVLAGVVLYFGGYHLGNLLGWPIIPPPPAHEPATWRALDLLPSFARDAGWWEKVISQALASLPVMLPFALATIVGGIDCTESAAAAGDEYNTVTILLTEGLASLAAGLCGGVIQTTPYIGHPAYKAMGGRAAYTLATAIFVGAAGASGWFTFLFDWLPEPAMFPILVFVGLEITAQSFKATPVRHYPALALAVLPALAYLAAIPMNMALAGRAPADFAAPAVLSLRCLANGFIVTSMLWAAALAAILDGRLRQAAGYLGIAAAFSLIGIIHSPLPDAAIAWPHDVLAQMSPSGAAANPAIVCQSPFHWGAAYLLAAGLLLILALFPAQGTPAQSQEAGTEPNL